jgi:hypothetical protein
MTTEELEALNALLEYVGSREETDFAEQDEVGRRNHIALSIRTLNTFVAKETGR